MAGAPYRAPTEGTERRLRVYPAFSVWVAVGMLFFGLWPAYNFLFLWSRQVKVDCSTASGAVVTCIVHEGSLVAESHHEVVFHAPQRAAVYDRGPGPNHDSIEVTTPGGLVPLASVFDGSPPFAKHELTQDLSQYFQEGEGASYHGAIGKRWATALIPLFTLAVAIGLWLYWGQSLTFIRRGSPAALAVEARRWPLPARRFNFELSWIAKVEVGHNDESRLYAHRRAPHLILCITNGERVVLGMLRGGKQAGRVHARAAAFLREA